MTRPQSKGSDRGAGALEVLLVRRGGPVLALVTALGGLLALAVRGPAGLVAVVAAGTVVGAALGASAALQAFVAARAPHTIMPALLAGYALRLLTYSMVLSLLAAAGIDRVAFAIAIAGVLLVTLTYESWVVATDRRFCSLQLGDLQLRERTRA